jgi:uncharacterized membrane protein
MKAFREVLAASGLLFAFLVTALHYPGLPRTIPSHFNASGAANLWSSKFTLWLRPAEACILYVAMTLVQFLPPNGVNFPADPKHRAAARLITLEMVGWFRAEIVWILAASTWWRVAAAESGKARNLWYVPEIAVAFIAFVTVLLYSWRIVRLGGKRI